MKNFFHHFLPVLSVIWCMKVVEAQTYSATSYEPDVTQVVLDAKQINTSKPVGVTAGAHSVDQMGGANYTIPIYVPPGTNGMVPNLSLNYNSLNNNGQLGWGWVLSGVSSITRVGQNNFQDGNLAPLQFDQSDKFVLDGQRLVVTNGGTYGADGTEYDTELAQFSKITSHGSYNDAPDHFTMITKDGMLLEFGFTDPSKQIVDVEDLSLFPPTTTHISRWYLSKIQDPFGNYVSFHYNDVNLGGNTPEEKLLTEVRYTGNDNIGLTPYNTVEFDYSVRSDKKEAFVGGHGKLPSYHLLEEITVKTGTTTVKRYDLKYSLHDIGHSYLTEIVEYGSSGSDLNSTLFKYNEPDNSTSIQPYPGLSDAQNKDYFIGDFDGNGISDVMRLSRAHDSHGNPFHSQLYVYLNGSSTASYYDPLTVTGNQLSWTYNSSYGLQATVGSAGSYSQYTPMDMDGDARSDILINSIEPSSFSPPQYTEFIYKGGTLLHDPIAGDFQEQALPAPPSPYRYMDRPWNFLFPGDYNGDGMTDLLAVMEDLQGSSAQFLLLTDMYGNWQPVHTTSNVNVRNADLASAMDLDGDGKPELLFLTDAYGPYAPNSCDIYTIDGSGLTAELTNSTGIPSADQDEFVIFPGDFNGDGKADILSLDDNDDWQIHYSNGNKPTSYYFTAPFSFSAHPYDNNDKLFVADFNGDGASDVYHIYNDFGTTTGQVYYSTGNYDGTASFIPLSAGLDQNSFEYLRLGDLNGDGKTDILNINWWSTPNASTKYLMGASSNAKLLNKIKDGFDREYEFVYGNMTGGVHTRGLDHSPPLIDVEFPMPLVATVIEPNGIGGLKYSGYNYSGAKVHRGRGVFLGFQGTSHSSTTMDRSSSLSYSFDETIGIRLPQEVTMSYDQTPTRSTTFDTEVVAVSAGRYYWRNASITELDLLANTTTITTNDSWDNFGNVLQSSVDVDNGLQLTTSTSLYSIEGPSDIPANLNYSEITVERQGQPPVTNSEHWTYDPFTGALVEHLASHGLRTSYEHDNAGNVSSISLLDPNLGYSHMRNKKFEYDSRYQFLVKEEKLLGSGYYYEMEYLSFDERWGKPTEVTGYEGLTIRQEFDEFGRLLWERAPHLQGTSRYDVTYSYDNWILSGNEYHVTHVQDPSAPDRSIYYDQLGRAVKEETEIMGHDRSMVLTTYDTKGRVQSYTDPHTSSEPVLTTSTIYDGFDRVIFVNDPRMGTVQTTYGYANGILTTTTTKQSTGQSGSTTTDATGLVVSASDDGGDLEYEYDSWGNLLSVSHNGFSPIESEYDEYGRQVALHDASAGSTEYAYNAFGEITWQMDARGNEVTMEYDKLGRLTTKNTPEGDFNYSYFFNGNHVTDLPSMIEGPNVTETFHYDDDYLRLTAYEKSVPSNFFVTEYVNHPTFDRVTKVMYDTGVEIYYDHDPNGFIDHVRRDGTVLYDAMTMDGRGAMTEYVQGNGITTTRTYDSGFPTLFDARHVQNLAMNFDHVTGNLMDRWDRRVERREYFTYDDLDRLKSSEVYVVDGSGQTVQGVSSLEYAYDGSAQSRGNLVERTDIGKFGVSGHRTVRAHGHDWPYDAYAPPLEISEHTQEMSYTWSQQPQTINEEVDGNGYVMEFIYDNQQQRCYSMLDDGNGTTIEKWYNGTHERMINSGTGDEYDIHYVSGGAGICAMIVIHNGDEHIFPVYTDHLGSIVAVTDMEGAVIAEQNFDPWGRRRNPALWDYDITPTAPPVDWLYRGYTGHEHIDPFRLVNMNGRVYDPLNGRMLSPDNFIASPFSTQTYNRYSYALNNPLKYTDPNGEWVHIVVGAVVGGVINLAANWDNVDGFWEGAAAFGIGAGAGAATAACGTCGAALWIAAGTGAAITATNNVIEQTGQDGQSFSGPVDWGEVGYSAAIGGVSGAVGHGAGSWATNNLGNAVVNGLSIKSPVLAGAINGAIGGSVGGAAGGFAGGFLLSGGNVEAGLDGAWNGAKTGATIGGAAGGGSAYIEAVSRGINPWNGNTNKVNNFDFTDGSGRTFDDPNRTVPRNTLRDGILQGDRHPDYHAHNPNKDVSVFYSRQTINGKTYNIKIVYNPTTNQIYHFHFQSKAFVTPSGSIIIDKILH